MYNISETRKAIYGLFDKVLKWKDIPSGRTRQKDAKGNLETTLTEEIKKLPVEISSMRKENLNHYLHRMSIELNFENMSPIYIGQPNEDGIAEVEEELKILIQAFFEAKYDEWRDSP